MLVEKEADMIFRLGCYVDPTCLWTLATLEDVYKQSFLTHTEVMLLERVIRMHAC
jgi:hypothetical protein